MSKYGKILVDLYPPNHRFELYISARKGKARGMKRDSEIMWDLKSREYSWVATAHQLIQTFVRNRVIGGARMGRGEEEAVKRGIRGMAHPIDSLYSRGSFLIIKDLLSDNIGIMASLDFEIAIVCP